MKFETSKISNFGEKKKTFQSMGYGKNFLSYLLELSIQNVAPRPFQRSTNLNLNLNIETGIKWEGNC